MAMSRATDESPLVPLIVVVGPTASGKSALGARLGARLGGEVVSADSVQVYRHFDIGAGKPSADELRLCPHHLIDVREPDCVLEANVWAELARTTISSIVERGRVAIVCGGTFLWVRALLYGLAEAPAGDETIRERHRELERSFGRAHVHRLLQQVDPRSAEKLHENDFVRVSRALEVYELSGRPLSEIQAEHGFARPHYAARLLCVDWSRDEYEQRLAHRTRAMLEAGFVEETERLIGRGFGETRAMGSVGYRQVKEWLDEEPRSSVSELEQRIVRVTRVFARRQRTWLRQEPVEHIDPRAISVDQVLDDEIDRLGLVTRA